jgi:hypothetical protein
MNDPVSDAQYLFLLVLQLCNVLVEGWWRRFLLFISQYVFTVTK